MTRTLLNQAVSPKVSVIVPAYRGRATLADCLGSIQRSLRGWDHEILVIESSGDGSTELIRRDFSNVFVIESPRRLSAGAARNLGSQIASGYLLFFVDQDCLVPVDWIQRLSTYFRHEDVGAAGGSISVADPGNWSGWCVYFLEFFNHFPSRRGEVNNRNFLIGANSVWRAEVLQHVQFPDQTLGEDLLLTVSLRDMGLEVVYDPSISVSHHNRRGWAEFFRYTRAMGRAAAKDQRRIGGWQINLLERWPLLCHGIPFLIIPLIGWRLSSAPRPYFMRYMLLWPACLIGQMFWVHEFKTTLIHLVSQDDSPPSLKD